MRVAVLHAMPKGFCCRHCTHLIYGSQFEQPYDRLLRSARRIRQRLGGGINLLEAVPDRPKGMHRKTYETLIRAEDDCWQWIGNHQPFRRFSLSASSAASTAS